jgi:hypothetical protein
MSRVFVLWYWVISTYIGSGYPIVLWGSCSRCVYVCTQFSLCCVSCVIRLVSYCWGFVWARCIPCGRSLNFVLCRYS